MIRTYEPAAKFDDDQILSRWYDSRSDETFSSMGRKKEPLHVHIEVPSITGKSFYFLTIIRLNPTTLPSVISV